MAEVNETVPATVSPAVAKATEAGSVPSSPAAVEKVAEAEAVPDSPPPTVERPVAHVEEAISPATVSKVAAAAEKVSLNEESRAQEHDAPLACPCPNSNPAPIPIVGLEIPLLTLARIPPVAWSMTPSRTADRIPNFEHPPYVHTLRPLLLRCAQGERLHPHAEEEALLREAAFHGNLTTLKRLVAKGGDLEAPDKKARRPASVYQTLPPPALRPRCPPPLCAAPPSPPPLTACVALPPRLRSSATRETRLSWRRLSGAASTASSTSSPRAPTLRPLTGSGHHQPLPPLALRPRHPPPLCRPALTTTAHRVSGAAAAPPQNGYTALMHAALHGAHHCVDHLIVKGANVNAQSHVRRSPAAAWRHGVWWIGSVRGEAAPRCPAAPRAGGAPLPPPRRRAALPPRCRLPALAFKPVGERVGLCGGGGAGLAGGLRPPQAPATHPPAVAAHPRVCGAAAASRHRSRGRRRCASRLNGATLPASSRCSRRGPTRTLSAR